MRKARSRAQRERLLAAMVKLATEGGYESATVTRVVADAGVPRGAFYDHFVDGEDCFLAALRDIQRTVLAEVERAVNGAATERPAAAAVTALLGFADSHPVAARFWINEAMAGGLRVLDARDWAIDEIDRIVTHAYHHVPTATAGPDVSTAMLLGAICRLLAPRLRRGGRSHAPLLDDLLGWIDSYTQPFREHRWRALRPGPTPLRSAFLPEVPLRPPAISRGRARRSETRLADNHRQRIVFATAEVVLREGYRAATVAQISGLAGLDRRAFYQVFAGKEEAFLAVQELSFRRAMAVTAGAFFSGGSWPERVWEAGRTLTQFMEQNSTLAYASLIDSHAAGPLAVKRLEDRTRAFTIFLDGYQREQHANEPSQLILEAIAATNFEIAYRQARGDGDSATARLLPHLTYICLTPFLGSAAANAVIDAQLEVDRESSRHTS